MRAPEPEAVVEIALALFGALILAGLGVLICARAGGAVATGRGHAEAPPAAGSVPAAAHQNIGASSPR